MLKRLAEFEELPDSQGTAIEGLEQVPIPRREKAKWREGCHAR
jgi:hypothetical protein